MFNSSATNQADTLPSDQAVAELLRNTFLEIGVDALVGHRRAFITCQRSFLCPDYFRALPSDRVGIDVLVDGLVDDDLVDVLRTLSGLGYSIALEGFTFDDHLRPLLELVDIIKLDVQKLDRATVEAHVGLLRQYDVKLLAENVETKDDFTFCLPIKWCKSISFGQP